MSRSPYYIEKWVDTLECMKLQAAKDIPDIRVPNTREEDSDGTWSSQALEEYLVDVNNGMDIEGAMAEAGITTGNIEGGAEGDRDENQSIEGSTPWEVEFDENERVDISTTQPQVMELSLAHGKGSESGTRPPPRSNQSGKGKHGYLAFPMDKKPPWDNR